MNDPANVVPFTHYEVTTVSSSPITATHLHLFPVGSGFVPPADPDDDKDAMRTFVGTHFGDPGPVVMIRRLYWDDTARVYRNHFPSSGETIASQLTPTT
ncbi:hypothetical protein [Nocardia terpenica]|uniref:Uncharacterized protein n=1 Tax=Nocardia terpenica TaxID=455432 RepID=A0A6G9ZDT0_9NOCA|nr:hypothetical protein [Nocardia terpenica]QIS23672.1 hypothetical protein F6W96_40770 [Nocardia terpenica]